MMTITFLLLFFISLFYGILVTLIKVSKTEVAYTDYYYYYYLIIVLQE